MIEFCESGGSFRNTTVRGSITGETLDIGIIDDAIKGREEANSQTVRDNTWSWFTDDFMSRFDELAGMLFITTRWHKDDPAGRLIKSDPNVKVFEFKAIAEKDEENRKEGEALFPEHKSLDFLLSRKEIMPAGNWQALFQQSPVIVGGNKFKSEWWKYYTMLPKIRTRIIYGDTAQKKEQQHDYTVFQCWGISYDDQLYLIDQYRGKIESPELLIQARAFWNKHKAVAGLGTLSAFKVEDKVSGTGLIQTLKREGGVPIIGIPRSTDKILRSEDVLPMIESGNVFLPRS
jgi:predicted phage terminase large subunit-like protein